MPTLNLPVDSLALVAALTAAGYTVTAPAPVIVAPPPVIVVPNSVIYSAGKLGWPGDWSGRDVSINYADGTLIPGLTVASIKNINAFGYWLPYIIHFPTSQVSSLVLRLRPAVPGAHFGLVTYTSDPVKTDITVGSLDQLDAYQTAFDTGNDIVTYTVPLAALKSANIDLYKILVQDKSGTKGTTWAVVDARFV